MHQQHGCPAGHLQTQKRSLPFHTFPPTEWWCHHLGHVPLGTAHGEEPYLDDWLYEQVGLACLVQEVSTPLCDVLGEGRNLADIDSVTCSSPRTASLRLHPQRQSEAHQRSLPLCCSDHHDAGDG